MSYIGTEPKDIRSFGRTKFDYTATQGQTAFTGADDDGKVLAFTVGQIEVYVNGILMDDSDFTTTGTGTVTLASAANLNDVINIVSFETNIPDSNYVPATGGTFTGDVTHTGAFTSQGIDDNANATAITIDSSENVLVGTTSTTVYTSGSGGDAGVNLRADGQISNSSNSASVFNRMASDGPINLFYKNGSEVGRIGTIGGDTLTVGSGDTGLLMNQTNDEIIPWNVSSNAARDNAVDLGDASHRFKDLYLSGGAYLGGTTSANYLNMYQQGTYTIAERHGQATITNNRVHYTRIGNVVFVAASIAVGSNSNGNVLNLTLPISSNINGYYLGGGNTSYTSLANTYKDNLKVNVENAADNVFFTYGNSNTHLTCANASGARIDFFCMYHI